MMDDAIELLFNLFRAMLLIGAGLYGLYCYITRTEEYQGKGTPEKIGIVIFSVFILSLFCMGSFFLWISIFQLIWPSTAQQAFMSLMYSRYQNPSIQPVIFSTVIGSAILFAGYSKFKEKTLFLLEQKTATENDFAKTLAPSAIIMTLGAAMLSQLIIYLHDLIW